MKFQLVSTGLPRNPLDMIKYQNIYTFLYYVRIPTKLRGYHHFKSYKSWKLQVKPSWASGDLEIWSLGWDLQPRNKNDGLDKNIPFQTCIH